MASKIQKKFSVSAKGIIDVTDGIVSIENEDTGELINLATLIEDFDGKDCSLSINYGEDY